ncbi:MAG: hypothetical protein OSB41_12645, partial [Kiritimatiellae bacterium]|nr:hypothetical protein [Kiritimatiellia bacterium]
GVQLTQLVLDHDEVVRGSTRDLRVWFFCLKQAPGADIYNAVGRPWHARDFPERELGTGAHWLVLTVQGMGDLNAVDIAQCTHEAILVNNGAFPLETVLRYGQPVPEGPLWTGVYVDDHLAVLRLPRSQLQLPVCELADGLLEKRVENAYLITDGVDEAPEKRHLFKTEFLGWGTAVDGDAGTAGTGRGKLNALSCAFFMQSQRKYVWKKVMERLAHSATHPIMHRRELFSIFFYSYAFINEMDYDKMYFLPAAVSDELVYAALLLPLAYADLRWPVSPDLLATDATPVARGSTIVTVPKEIAKKFYIRSEHRGDYVRMDWDDEGEYGNHQVVRPAGEVFEAAVAGLPWRCLGGGYFRKREHVNVQELEALKFEVKRRVRNSGGVGIRQVVVIDSRVVVGCWGKGRSSSWRLNTALRGGLAWSVLGRVKTVVMWIGTKINPADDPSRFVELRAPAPMPPWIATAFSQDPVLAEVAQSRPKNPKPDGQMNNCGKRTLCEPAVIYTNELEMNYDGIGPSVKKIFPMARTCLA